MPQQLTEFPLGDPLAVQRWSQSLSLEAVKKMYFRKFIGSGHEAMIMMLTDLNKAAGEKITFALRMKLLKPGVEGDDILEGDVDGEEGMVFHNDAIFIDQQRKGTKSKGKMSEQRVPYNIRNQGKIALSDWWSEEFDEQIMYSLAGARGVVTAGMHNPLGYTGRANNPITAPDAEHLAYAGDATGPADMKDTDIVSFMSIEKLRTRAELIAPAIQPFRMGGKKKYIYLIHTIQAFKLRTSNTENDWLDIHKATDSGLGQKAMMYTDALGEYGGVIIHEHRNVVMFNNYGAGGNLPAARALFLGAQAGVIAYGRRGNPANLVWHEEFDDRGNALAISSGGIYGTKQTRFDNKTFGLFAEDSYCPLTI